MRKKVAALAPGIELLEARIAPATLTLLNARTARYTDFDGDLVTVVVSKGTLKAEQFTFADGPLGSQLLSLNLATDDQVFAKASLSITATRTAAGGDGFVNVGFLEATGTDLGSVIIKGDLGRIAAGNLNSVLPALDALTVNSMGAWGTSTQAAGGSLESKVVNSVTRVVILTNLENATFTADYLGSVSIGGSLRGGIIEGTTGIGAISVAGSILGGSATNSGSIRTENLIDRLVVGGDVIGGGGAGSGSISADFGVRLLQINGSLLGGPANDSGTVLSGGDIDSLALGGSLIGGHQANTSGAGSIRALGLSSDGASIALLKIGGNVLGGAGTFSGAITSNGKLGVVSVGGSIFGSTGAHSGNVETSGGLGALLAGGSVTSGTTAMTGSILTSAGAAIGNVTIRGSLVGHGTSAGIFADGTLGVVTIGGDLRAENQGGVRISAQGVAGSTGLALAGLTVGGNVDHALILGGYSAAGSAVNPDAGIGVVSVGRNWLASSVVAGVAAQTNYGDGDDVKIAEPTPNAIPSRIAGVVIKGMALGTASATGDHYGFVAEQIGLLRVGAVTYPLAPGAASAADLTGYLVGPTQDLRVREVTSAPVTLAGPGANVPTSDLVFLNTHAARYTDVDGDVVTLTISKGTWTANDFTFALGPKGSQLQKLDLSSAVAGTFDKANLLVTVVRSASNGGDGYANIGFLDAQGIDLGTVSLLSSDLGRIEAGDANLLTPGLVALQAHSFGLLGTSTQASGGTLVSKVQGRVTAWSVKTDVAGAEFRVEGGSGAQLGAAAIGGNLAGGVVSVEGSIGTLAIGGSVLGGAVTGSGRVETAGLLGRVTIGGDVMGGAAQSSGTVLGGTSVGALTVKGNLVGGAGAESGLLSAKTGLTSLVIGGSLFGGSTASAFSGAVRVQDTANPEQAGVLGTGVIGGSLVGGGGTSGGAVMAPQIRGLSIGGLTLGGSGSQSGSIVAGLGLGNLALGGSLLAGDGAGSGTISGGGIGNVTIRGSVTGSAGAAIASTKSLGVVTITGDLRGAAPDAPVQITALGLAGTSGGLAGLSVAGSVWNARLLAGVDATSAAVNPDATIGVVSVGGNLAASSIAAGVTPAANYGGANDTHAPGPASALVSKIAGVFIKGYALGTPDLSTDHFGIVAEQIGVVRVGAVTYPLVAGASSPADLAGIALGSTGDLRIREI